MGILDIFKSKQSHEQTQYLKMLNNNAPIFSQFGTDIYASDVVQQGLYAIVTEMKKLIPKHVRTKGFDPVTVEDSDVQWVLDNPNELMTTSDFIEKFMWNLLLNYNSFIYKECDKRGVLSGLYPVSPTNVTFLQDRQGTMYVKMTFKTGYEATLPYGSFIHLRSHYSVDELMGGNEQGQPDNEALLKVLNVNDILMQGVKKSLTMSYAINGIIQYAGLMGDEKGKAIVQEFEEKLKRGSSGILPTTLKMDYTPMKRDLNVVDEATLRFIDDKILRHIGTPIEIVRGSYTPEQYEAFYQKTLEHFIINISQTFTKSIFTERQKGFKNEIKLYPRELVFMSISQTIAMVNILGQSGTLFENEKRVAFGYAPLPELVGIRQKSLNFVSVDIADEYQLTNASRNANANKNTPTGTNEDGDNDQDTNNSEVEKDE